MPACANLVTYFQFHRSSFLFCCGEPQSTTTSIILFPITERYSWENTNNFKTKVKISGFSHGENGSTSQLLRTQPFVLYSRNFWLNSQDFDFIYKTLTSISKFWPFDFRRCFEMKISNLTIHCCLLLHSHCAHLSVQLPTLTLLPPSLLVAVGWGRPTATHGRPAHLLHRVRCDLCLRRDLWTSAALLQVVQEDAEAAAEAIPLPEALNSRRPLGGFNLRLNYAPQKAHWKDSHEVDVL